MRQDHRKLAAERVEALGLQQRPRVRAGMSNIEMTCAIPGACPAEATQRLKTARAIDATVARYAADDAIRF